MADSKISDLAEATSLAASDLFVIAQEDTANKKVLYSTVLGGGWVPNPTTLTRTGNHTFTESGDTTAKWQKGTRFEYTQSAVVEYGVVQGSSHSAGTTTVTLATNSDFAMAAGALDTPRYSYAASPQGWPTVFNYVATEVGWSSTTRAVSKFSILGSQYLLTIDYVGTSDNAATTITLPITSLTATYPYGVTWITNNGTNGVGRWYLNDTSTLKFGISITSDTWTASGTKAVAVQCVIDF